MKAGKKRVFALFLLGILITISLQSFFIAFGTRDSVKTDNTHEYLSVYSGDESGQIIRTSWEVEESEIRSLTGSLLLRAETFHSVITRVILSSNHRNLTSRFPVQKLFLINSIFRI